MNLSGSTIQFPFRSDARGTFVVTGNREDLVSQAIADLIETRRGERVMLPDYGIDDYVFAVQNSSFAARLEFHLEEQIRRYVPLVRTVTVKVRTDESGKAIATVRYTTAGTIESPQNLVFPIWRLDDE